MKIRMNAVAIDQSGNEQEVAVYFDVGYKRTSGGTKLTECHVFADSETPGTFVVKEISGKFNPWGPTSPPSSNTDTRKR